MKCIESADFALDNNGTFQQLFDQIETIMEEVNAREKAASAGIAYRRPSWDEYLWKYPTPLPNATCDRGRSDAL